MMEMSLNEWILKWMAILQKNCISNFQFSSNAGGKFVKSFNTTEVTISESEIAELEKPKVKEVKPKDVEGEKVGKTEAKFKKSKTKFSSENGDINSIFKNGKET